MAYGLRSIGQVLARLTPEFPELSASKLRYLEEQGLVTPLRTEAGYRDYCVSALNRVQFILAEPLGRHPLLAQVVLQRAEEAVEPRQKWTVHRQDDNGNRFVVQTGLSRLEAEQSVADYERLGHKQLYWTEMEHGGG